MKGYTYPFRQYGKSLQRQDSCTYAGSSAVVGRGLRGGIQWLMPAAAKPLWQRLLDEIGYVSKQGGSKI